MSSTLEKLKDRGWVEILPSIIYQSDKDGKNAKRVGVITLRNTLKGEYLAEITKTYHDIIPAISVKRVSGNNDISAEEVSLLSEYANEMFER